MANPTEYLSSNYIQTFNIQQIINEFDDELAVMSGKCMDIGCGPGDITKNILLEALASDAKMIGTDIAENMIEFANRTHAEKQRLLFEVLDIQTKNLPRKYISEFDHIFSFHTLHWCSNIRLALENIYKMLKPGGTVLIIMASTHEIFDVFQTLSCDARYASYIDNTKGLVSPFQYSTRPHKEMKDLLKSVGFQIHHCSHRRSYVFDSGNFLSSIMSFTSFLNKMPYKLREEFRDDFSREYLKTKIICKQLANGQELSGILDLQRLLIVYAQK